MVFQGNLGNAEIAMGSFAIAGSLVITLTYFLFPNLRKLRYVELVLYIAINDLIASIGLAMGPVPNDSFACWFQALSTDICYVSSAFWTVVILYQVYLVVIKRGSVLKNMLLIHLFCWGCPIVLAMLPLSTNTYNNPDDESTWCFIANRRDSPPWGELFWVLFSFFFWIWLSILVNVVQIVHIMLELRSMQVVSTAVISTVRKLIFYPLITFLCWTLNTAANMYVFSSDTTFATMDSGWSTLASVGVILALSQGLLNCIVFIGMNTIVREHWKELLYRVYMLMCCCTRVKERTIVRHQSSDVESPVHKQVFEMEMSTHDSGRFDRPSSARESTVDLFRDTFAQDSGTSSSKAARLSAYFSVSLPVEDQSDYIGDINDHARYRGKQRPLSGTRPRRASNYNVRDSNFMRRSSLLEMVRGSVSALLGMGDGSGEGGGGDSGVEESGGSGEVKGSGDIVDSDDVEGGAVGHKSIHVTNADTSTTGSALTTIPSSVTLDEYSAATRTTDTIHEERDSQVSAVDLNAFGVSGEVDKRDNDSEHVHDGTLSIVAPENDDNSNVYAGTAVCGDASKETDLANQVNEDDEVCTSRGDTPTEHLAANVSTGSEPDSSVDASNNGCDEGIV